jgi:hypothetical protein
MILATEFAHAVTAVAELQKGALPPPLPLAKPPPAYFQQEERQFDEKGFHLFKKYAGECEGLAPRLSILCAESAPLA